MLCITGEVITTPYSFVARAHALDTLNMDPARIEAAITPQTTTILPVPVYGRLCL